MSGSTDFLVRVIGDSSKGISEFGKFGSKVKTELNGAKGSFSSFGSIAKGAIAGLGLATIGAKIGDFASQSVAAYKESEVAQQRLMDAYDRFPALADVNIEKLQALNTELGKKTRFDDDATASGQAVLAQYGLTGQQLQKLTPLLQDYAAKTGKDLPTAAADLGKAVLGQGRALKGIGLNFTDTGSAAGNLEQLMGGLRTQVGGFAENEAKTGTGQAAILANQFGEVQETIGSGLMPILSAFAGFLLANVIPAIQSMAEWISQNMWVVGAVGGLIGALLVGAFIAWASSIWAVNAALFASPITWIILAIIALVAAIVWLVLNWDQVVAWITSVWSGFVSWITGVMQGFVSWWNGLWSGIVAWVSAVWLGFVAWIIGAISGFVAYWNSSWSAIGKFVSNIWNNYIVKPITTAINWITTRVQAGLNLVKNVWNATWNGLGSIVKGAFNGVLGWIQGGINGAIDLINGMIRSVNDVGGAIGINIGLIPHVSLPRLAGGGVTTGPMMAIIGDNPGGREYVEPVDRVAARLERVAIAAASGSPRQSSGPMRIAREDLDYMADRVGNTIYPLIMKGAQKTVASALGG